MINSTYTKIAKDRRFIIRTPKLTTVFLMIALPLFLLGMISPKYITSLVTDIVIFSIYAMGYDILLGFTNQFSYGQALYFGLGAYGVLLSVLHMGVNLWTGIIIALTICVFISLLLGSLSVRLTGAYFVIITIIFNLVFYFLALSWVWLTGGDDGLTFTVPPLDFLLIKLSLNDHIVKFCFIFSLFIISFLILERLISSPLGRIFIGIRENEERLTFLGYDVFRYKLIAYVVSALFSGLSGALYAIRLGYASAEFFSLSLSALPIVYTLVGGMGTLIGPVIGTIIILPFTYFVGALWKHYFIIVGALIILLLKFNPKGVIGYIMKYR